MPVKTGPDSQWIFPWRGMVRFSNILFDMTGVYTWSILAAVAAGLLGMAAVAVLPAHKKQPRQA